MLSICRRLSINSLLFFYLGWNIFLRKSEGNCYILTTKELLLGFNLVVQPQDRFEVRTTDRKPKSLYLKEAKNLCNIVKKTWSLISFPEMIDWKWLFNLDLSLMTVSEKTRHIFGNRINYIWFYTILILQIIPNSMLSFGCINIVNGHM